MKDKFKLEVRTKTLAADLQTPVGIYMKVRDMYERSALLESSDFHTAQNGFSFIGVGPIASFEVSDGKIVTTYPDGSSRAAPIRSPLDIPGALKAYTESFELSGENESGINGLFGFTAYDCVEHFESVKISKRRGIEPKTPDMLQILYRFIIVVNNFNNRMTIVENIPEGENSKLGALEDALHNNSVALYSFRTTGKLESTSTDAQYMAGVEKAVRHIKRGDAFQIVASRAFSKTFEGDDFNLYRALRCINPSPYLFYFDFGSFRIFGSSPETHLRVQKGRAYIDPIAGTFRRTGNDAKDSALAAELLKDPKENAEHIMLVDLARNDLSRNCEDVKIEFLKQIQYYSHVIHMVSRVSGRVPEGANTIKIFADTFPAGTLSGAPKVRAMQIIDDIEPHSRGVYGGCIGYIGFDGNINQAITIRTFLSRAQTLEFQAGAGIVAKSDPKSELAEVAGKLGALNKALEYAQSINNF